MMAGESHTQLMLKCYGEKSLERPTMVSVSLEMYAFQIAHNFPRKFLSENFFS